MGKQKIIKKTKLIYIIKKLYMSPKFFYFSIPKYLGVHCQNLNLILHLSKISYCFSKIVGQILLKFLKKKKMLVKYIILVKWMSQNPIIQKLRTRTKAPTISKCQSPSSTDHNKYIFQPTQKLHFYAPHPTLKFLSNSTPYIK